MGKKILTVLGIILLLILIPVTLLELFAKFDTNGDGKEDMKFSSNIRYLKMDVDVDFDGTYDIREYKSYHLDTIKMRVLNPKFLDFKIKEEYKDGSICIIEKDTTCPDNGKERIGISYIHNGEVIFAAGSF